MIDYDSLLEPFERTLATIGERARQLRLLQNFTQSELARRSGVGSATIQRFERTGHVSVENALRIAVALRAEDGFRRLFELPEYSSIDEALARSQKTTRKRARKQT